MNEQRRNKTHNLSLKNSSRNTSWIVDPFTKVRAAGAFYTELEVKCIKHLSNNYKYINVLNVPENSFKTLLFWFQLWFRKSSIKPPRPSQISSSLSREKVNKPGLSFKPPPPHSPPLIILY